KKGDRDIVGIYKPAIILNKTYFVPAQFITPKGWFESLCLLLRSSVCACYIVPEQRFVCSGLSKFNSYGIA
ncbi:MAG: hypothetical protein LBT50_03830, partial [Prevotellaceae bacterium]|nr:hypothetical protein [Prevotellaceae bacterium]